MHEREKLKKKLRKSMNKWMNQRTKEREREEGRGEEGRKTRGKKISYFNVLQKIKRSVPLY